MPQNPPPSWPDRFQSMLTGLGWSYEDAANAAGYKSGESIRATVRNTNRPIPLGLRLAVVVYERFAHKTKQRQNLINVMQADQESGLYENEEE